MVVKTLLRWLTSIVGSVFQFIGGILLLLTIPTAVVFLVFTFPAAVGQLGVESAMGVDLAEAVGETKRNTAVSTPFLGGILLVLCVSYAAVKTIARSFYSIGA